MSADMPAPPPVPEPPPRQKRPTWLQGLILGGGGLLAAIGGCATVIATDSFENVLTWAGGLVFIVGAIAVPIGGGMFIYGVIKVLMADSSKNG
jgi:hypothetical protein